MSPLSHVSLRSRFVEIARCQHPLPACVAMADSGFGSTPPAAGPMTVEGSHSPPFPDPSLAPAAGHYLPGNPLPYLASSATHQPELLLLSWMIATLHTLVTDLQHHPILTDPIPYPSSFTDQQSYRLYLQLRNTLRHLVTISTDLCQGIRILQFLPGSPGSPGHYRMDPTARFPPSATTNCLSSPILPPTHQPTAIPPQHSLITHLTPRARSRSRDRHTTTTSIQSTHTPYLQPNPNNQICRQSNWRQLKTNPMNRSTITNPLRMFNQLRSTPPRPLLHLPKHPLSLHPLFPNIPPHTEHARHAHPLEQPANPRLHLLPPLPAVKTRSS